MNTIKSLSFYVVIFATLLTINSANAGPIDTAKLPEPLIDWVDWVLHDERQIGCPYQWNDDARACAWPSTLTLDLHEQGGRFSQQWELFSEWAVVLPGNASNWPLNVTDGTSPVLVQSFDGIPFVTLPKGKHTLSGEFKWARLPKSLSVSPDSGLVDLSVNKQKVERPQLGEFGELWLSQSNTQEVSKDNVDMQVFRRIVDGHPLLIETLIKLRVSGKQRNMVLGSVLLNDFIATSINSDLPARLDGEQQLTLQLRPGEWSIQVTGRAVGDTQSFTMPDAKEPWPQQEVWVFVSDNNTRQVNVKGVTSVDPNQTRLPSHWRGLPAYLLSSNEVMALDVRERGITNLARNKLNLKREMWLDFDGGGYSIKDHISGEFQQSRISVLPSIELGQVRVNQQAQFITRDTDDNSGVEIRQKNLNLSAESRYTGQHSSLPSNGWQLDLQQVDTKLHLPPGWRLLAVNGVDNLPSSWLQEWSLLDLFLVMIIVLSIRRFYGWRCGALSLVTLVFVWQEPGAPTFIWLNLLAVTALLSVLSENKFSKILRNYRWLTLATLAVILLGYTINTIRISIYPQLETGYTEQWQSLREQSTVASKLQQPPAEFENDQSASIEEIVVMASKSTRVRKKNAPAYTNKQVDLKAIDPNSQIQSGPGLPSWSGYRTVDLSWTGPVKPEQQSRLFLVGPKANLFIKLLGIVLLLGLTWCFIRPSNTPSKPPRDWLRFFKASTTKSGSMALLLACFLLPVMPPAEAQQMLPDADLLETLHERLIQAPDCLSECAQIEQMWVTVSAQTLQVRLRVHALTSVSLPLPASQIAWLPTQVLVDNQPATALSRDADQVLWLALAKGRHDVVLSGATSKGVSFQLPLPLRPKYSAWVSSDNSWSVDGIDDDGIAGSQLQLTRVLSAAEQQSFEADHSTLATFVKIDRKLQFGLDWYVQTTVSRRAPNGVPLTLTIPLLAHEQLLGEQAGVELLDNSDGKKTQRQVRLNLTADQSIISWSSKLAIVNQMTLLAANDSSYLETWSIDASPVWRVKANGLPVNRYQSSPGRGQQRVVPVWQPWPAETLELSIDRPSGVDGQTVTIQGSQLSISSGKRVDEVTLSLTVRSSRGIAHDIFLPNGAEVQLLEIDGVKQRVQTKQSDKNTLSMTLKPGKQDIRIIWRSEASQSAFYEFPEVDLKLPSVNAHSNIKLPRDRWVLWAQGPVLGPAVLFWGVLSAFLLLSLILGFSKQTPLSVWQWFLLAIGLSQTSPLFIFIVVACFVSLTLREKLDITLKRWQFNFMQISLIVLILFSMGIMIAAVANGLLGSPDMQVVGNGSNSYLLKWYQDRASSVLPQAEIISVPIWIYRVLMLAWAMWLAMSLLKWIQWGWKAFNTGGFWRSASKSNVKVDDHSVETT